LVGQRLCGLGEKQTTTRRRRWRSNRNNKKGRRSSCESGWRLEILFSVRVRRGRIDFGRTVTTSLSLFKQTTTTVSGYFGGRGEEREKT